MYCFSHLEPVCCSMSSSNCCFLTCIQVSQEAGQVVWSSHFFHNFPVYCGPHKGFGKVNKAGVEVSLELSCFFDDPADVSNLISGSSAFSKTSLNIWKAIILQLKINNFFLKSLSRGSHYPRNLISDSWCVRSDPKNWAKDYILELDNPQTS